MPIAGPVKTGFDNAPLYSWPFFAPGGIPQDRGLEKDRNAANTGEQARQEALCESY